MIMVGAVWINFLVGCATWISYSKPSIMDDGAWQLSFSENRFEGVLEFNDLQLSIDPHNDGKSSALMIAPFPVPLGSYGSVQESKIFEVDITIIPGSQMHTFNPLMVSLSLKGKRYLPMGYAYLEEQICFERGADPVKASLIAHKLNNDIVLGEYNCFILQFDADSPDTKERFSIEVNGIKRDGGCVTVPEVYFSAGKRPSGF